MKTFLVDWGEVALGGRFALIQETSLERAALAADSIGSPFMIAELSIPRIDGDGPRYLEISQPRDPYEGGRIEAAAKWESGFDCLSL